MRDSFALGLANVGPVVSRLEVDAIPDIEVFDGLEEIVLVKSDVL